MPTAEEIRQALKDGKKVYWSNENYRVIPHEGGPMIRCKPTGHLIKLTQSDGTLNGKPEDFIIKEE